MQQPSFIAIDWGTSNFRLWAISGGGQVVSRTRNNNGMSKLKPGDYTHVLDAALAELGISVTLPTVICGMAGSTQGWMEAPYVDTPTSLENIPLQAVPVPGTETMVRILPGLAQRKMSAPDVMRGEETLILGAVLQRGVSGTICLPGTHSKWVTVDKAEVRGFSTSMTGEVFSLLQSHSVLAHSVQQAAGEKDDDKAFQSAVNEAVSSPEKILQALFSVRSTSLLQQNATARQMRARLSGLLLGVEIAGVRNMVQEQVTLISSGQLAHNYKRALNIAGFQCELIDADEMVLAGLCHAAAKIWPGLKVER